MLRAAVLVVSGEQQAVLDGGNEYVNGALEHERACFEAAVSVPAEVMTDLDNERGRFPAVATAGCGRGRRAWTWGAAWSLTCRCRRTRWTRGRGSRRGSRAGWLLAALDGGADAVVTRYGEARLDASRVLAEVSPATVATGIDLWLARPAGAGEAVGAG